MSLTKRTTMPILRAPAYSDSQVPAAIPNGAPMSIARPHMIALPKKAFAKPPLSCGGGVLCVNSAQSIPTSPLLMVVQRIQPRKTRPNNAAAQDKIMAMALMALRLRNRRCDVRF